MAEFVLGHMLAHERHFYAWLMAQRERRWRSADPSYTYRSLQGLTVGIMGASGSIGSCIASTCLLFGMKVKGLRTAAAAADGQDGKQRISWFSSEPADSGSSGPARIPAAFLHELDYLINVLPSTPSTRFMLGGDDGSAAADSPLRHCRPLASRPPHTVFINLGRGDVISDAQLLRALLGSGFASLLQSAQTSLPVPGADAFLSAAVLDVFNTEPLPASHPFYSLSPPLLTISPHVSGLSEAAKQPIVSLFLDNLQRFSSHEPLMHELQTQRGY